MHRIVLSYIAYAFAAFVVSFKLAVRFAAIQSRCASVCTTSFAIQHGFLLGA
jgi:hypothetical protein